MIFTRIISFIILLSCINPKELITYQNISQEYISHLNKGVICLRKNGDKFEFYLKNLNFINQSLLKEITKLTKGDISIYYKRNDCSEFSMNNPSNTTYLIKKQVDNYAIQDQFIYQENKIFLKKYNFSEKIQLPLKKPKYSMEIYNSYIDIITVFLLSEKVEILKLTDTKIFIDLNNYKFDLNFPSNIEILSSSLNILDAFLFTSLPIHLESKFIQKRVSLFFSKILEKSNKNTLFHIKSSKIETSHFTMNYSFFFSLKNHSSSDHSKRSLQSNSSYCSTFQDCFNCSQISENSNNCTWFQGKCIQSNLPQYNDYWWNAFESCIDDNSAFITRTYCGDTSKNIPASFIMPLNGKYYGLKYLFCNYEIENDSGYTFTLLLNKTNYSNDKYDIVSVDQYGNFLVNAYPNGGIYSNITRVYLKYFSTGPKSVLPFILQTQISSNSSSESSGSFSSLFISIGVIVSICLVCSICFYKCSKMIVENANKKLKKTQIPSNDMLNNPEIPGIYNNGIPIPLDPAERERQIRDINTKILNEKLNKEFQPIEYNQTMNEFGCNCTICLEGFSSEIKVCVLPCKHLFHFNCWKDWLFKNIMDPKCPNCNYHVFEMQINEKGILNIQTVEVKSPNRVSNFIGDPSIANLNLNDIPRSPGVDSNNFYEGNNNSNHLSLNLNPQNYSRRESERLNIASSAFNNSRQRVSRNNFV